MNSNDNLKKHLAKELALISKAIGNISVRDTDKVSSDSLHVAKEKIKYLLDCIQYDTPGKLDPLYRRVLAACKQANNFSIIFIQKTFNISYNRTTEILDTLMTEQTKGKD